MAIPSKVLEQEKAADEAIAAQQAQRAAEMQPPAEQPAAAPQAPQKPAEEAPAPAAPNTAPQGGDWESKYRVLSGKYNAEVPRALAEIKALRAKVEELTKAPPAAAAPAPAAPTITAEEVEQYGPEFIDMLKRVAQQQFGTREAELLSEINLLKSRVDERAATEDTAKEAQFFAALSGAHSDWEAVNNDEKFLQYLGEYDPQSRRIRQTLLDEAVTARDSDYVIELLSRWKALNKSGRSRPQPSVEPQGRVTGDVPEQREKRSWSKTEVDKFYTDWSRGKIKDADAAAIELDIQSAAVEGRITK